LLFAKIVNLFLAISWGYSYSSTLQIASAAWQKLLDSSNKLKLKLIKVFSFCLRNKSLFVALDRSDKELEFMLFGSEQLVSSSSKVCRFQKSTLNKTFPGR
jgi:hypothetical protein